MTAQDVSLVIAICTYKRPASLAKALGLILDQAASSGTRVRIVVIDNDPLGTAFDTVDVLASRSVERGIEVLYQHEPRRGVGYARNRAFTLARAGEWLLFFDDDQRPSAGWLDAFAAKTRASDEGIWTGPVIPQPSQAWPSWASDGWAWGSSRNSHQDGAVRRTCGFGNVLISPAVLADEDCIVPAGFASGAGEDTVVTLKLSSKGWQIRQLNAARAVECVGPERLTKSWVRRRFFGYGFALSRARRHAYGRRALLWNLLAAAKAFAMAIAETARILVARPPAHALVAASSHLSRAGGLIAGNLRTVD